MSGEQSRAVLDILEVNGRVCGRAGCLHEKHVFVKSFEKIVINLDNIKQHNI